MCNFHKLSREMTSALMEQSRILVLAGTGMCMDGELARPGSCSGWAWCHSWGQLKLETHVG